MPPVCFQGLGSATVHPAVGLLKVTYCLCVHSVTPGDVGAVGSPLIGVGREAPWVLRSIRVPAVVLPEASETNTPTRTSMIMLTTVLFTPEVRFLQLWQSRSQTRKMYK